MKKRRHVSKLLIHYYEAVCYSYVLVFMTYLFIVPVDVPDESLRTQKCRFFPFGTLHQDEEVDLSLRYISMNDCKTCGFYSNIEDGNSKNTDLLITYSNGQAKRLFPFLKTLRTSNSICKTVVFMTIPELETFNENEISELEKCGCQIISFDNLRYSQSGLITDNFCYFLMYLFIEKNLNLFQRIIYTNLKNTVFQGDPFNSMFPTFGLIISDEELNGTYRYTDNYLAGSANLVKDFMWDYLLESKGSSQSNPLSIFNSIMKKKPNKYQTNCTDIRLYFNFPRSIDEKLEIGDIRSPDHSMEYATVVQYGIRTKVLMESINKYCNKKH